MCLLMPSFPRRRVLATPCATPSSASAELVPGRRPRAELRDLDRATPTEVRAYLARLERPRDPGGGYIHVGKECRRRARSRRFARREATLDHRRPRTEFTSRALEGWAYDRGVELYFIRPG